MKIGITCPASLPIYPSISKKQQDLVISCIEKYKA